MRIKAYLNHFFLQNVMKGSWSRYCANNEKLWHQVVKQHKYDFFQQKANNLNVNKQKSTNLGFPPPCSSPAPCGGHDCCFKTRPLEPSAVVCDTKVDARRCFPLPRPRPLSSQSDQDKQTQITSGSFVFDATFPSACLWAHANHLRVRYWFSSPGWPLWSSFLSHWWQVGESTAEPRWKKFNKLNNVHCASRCTFSIQRDTATYFRPNSSL